MEHVKNTGLSLKRNSHKSLALMTFIALAMMASSVTPINADHADAPTRAKDQAAAAGDLDFFLDPNDNSGAIIPSSSQTRLTNDPSRDMTPSLLTFATTSNPIDDPTFFVTLSSPSRT